MPDFEKMYESRCKYVTHDFKILRKAKGVSQRKLSQDVGCHLNTYQRIENDKIKPTKEMFVRIMEYLHS